LEDKDSILAYINWLYNITEQDRLEKYIILFRRRSSRLFIKNKK
jgi:hypothetical protein